MPKVKKLKIGILTFHSALNYGAILQTYALQQSIKKLGADVEIINYQAPFNEKRFKNKTLKDLTDIRTLYNVLFRNGYKIYNRENFSKFYDELSLSDVCKTKSELKKVCQKYDRIVCGSDQVWNISCTENDDSYFLPFITDSYKKTSYAASIGFEKLPDCYKEKYSKWISEFSEISVREKSAATIIEELTGRKAECVVDPTLLLNKNEWLEIADYSKVPQKKYVLLYLMSEDKKIISFAKKIAKRENCKIVYINERLFNLNGAENLRNVTPTQWLGLFDKAEFVVTNSFHGTAFSINFEKEFFVRYIPHSIANTRLYSILKEYNFLKREVDETDCETCDFVHSKLKLCENREKSMSFIKKGILGIKDET